MAVLRYANNCRNSVIFTAFLYLYRKKVPIFRCPTLWPNVLKPIVSHDNAPFTDAGKKAIRLLICVKRKAALEETARILGLPCEEEDVVPLPDDGEKQSEGEPTDSLCQLPRVSALDDSVFLLPMNTQLLHELSPLDYLRTHIVLSKSGVSLYRRTFCKLSHEHVLPQKHMQIALSQVVGRSLTEEDVAALHKQLGWSSDLDFSTWCGLAAAVERLACIRKVSGRASPSSEIERADMATLERYLAAFPSDKPCPPLASLLRSLTSL